MYKLFDSEFINNNINNDPYQLLKKGGTTKIKARKLKQLKILQDNEVINDKLYYYLKPTDLPVRLDFMVNQKYTSQESLYVLLFHIVVPVVQS